MHFRQWKRREAITLLGGAAAWPSMARAQQPAMPVVGLLYPTSPDTIADRLRGFRQGLKETGYIAGESVTIEYRWAEGQFDRLPALAADLVRRQVLVIAAGSTSSALAAKAATSSIPIVFSVNEDPVKLGLVASLARPGGNLTGINFLNAELVAKRLELIRELVSGAARVAVLVNPTNAVLTENTLRDVATAARAIGLQVQVLNASTSREIDATFAALVRERPDALFIANDGFFNSRRVQIVNAAARHAIPATYGTREFAEVGGLMSYGVAVLSNTLVQKPLEMLHEVVSSVTLVALLVNPKNPLTESDTKDVQSAAGSMRQQILVLNVSNESDLKNAFAAITERRAEAMLVHTDPFLNGRLDQIAAFTTQHRVPAVSSLREFVRAGGLISYGTDVVDAYRQLGLYVGKILKGAKPSELPVQQAVKVEFAINLRTARTLGLTIPLPLSGRADEVIE
jgi:putative ABC transport system substrate-binding protein